MDISAIRNPLFLKDLSFDELKKLCSELRDYIISYCSRNGGYLSGNLSSVEVSVMLNRIFDAEDCLLFDGNDLNYTNKLLHGKADELQINSNGAYSLANALGLAVSRDLNHKKHNVVVVVNSSDLLSGRYIEALNQISNLHRRLIIIFNDDTTIDRGIGILDRLIANLRKTKSYNSLKDNVKDMIRPVKQGEKIIENIHNVKANIRKTIVDEGIFSEFDIDYVGPIDGHNLNDLERAFEIAKDKVYPTVVHCLTTKGKGYKYAEATTSDSWNKVGPFDVDSGKQFEAENGNYFYLKHVAGLTVEKMMEKNEDLLCVTSRNINDYGVANIFAKYPSRSFDTSSSAENSLSFAAGLALDGKIPFIPLKSFELSNAFRVLKNQICKLNRPLIIGLIDGGFINYDLLQNLDNIYIYEPKDSSALQDILYCAPLLDKPIIIIYPEKCAEFAEKDDFNEIKLGIWPKLTNNDMSDTAILASGLIIPQLLKVINANELKCDLYDTASHYPYDDEALSQILSGKKTVYVLGDKLSKHLLNYANVHKTTAEIIFIDEDNTSELFEKLKQNA